MAGRVFEDLLVGMTFTHEPSRTVTETDNLLITTLTMNPQPLHLDAEFATATEFGRILVNSMFTVSLVVGLSVGDTTLGTTIGNLGFEKIEVPKPVFVGDTITSRTTVLEARRSRSRPVTGIVLFELTGTNQRGEVVCRARRNALMKARTRGDAA